MGGFTLVGENYVFTNKENAVKCRCLGYTGKIDKDVEDQLLKDEEHILRLESLPEDLLSSMESFHLGDEKAYTVSRRLKNKMTDKASKTDHPFGGAKSEFRNDVFLEESAKSYKTDVGRNIIKGLTPWFRKESQ